MTENILTMFEIFNLKRNLITYFKIHFLHRISYHELRAERKYIVNLELSVCFESASTCTVVASVLQNTALPQRDCERSAEMSNYQS